MTKSTHKRKPKAKSVAALMFAAMTGDQKAKDLAEDQITLTQLCSQRMFCAASGAVLDARTAIAAEAIATNGAVRFLGPWAPGAVDAPDAIQDKMTAVMAARQDLREVRLLVGAELFDPVNPRQRRLTRDSLQPPAPAAEQIPLPLAD